MKTNTPNTQAFEDLNPELASLSEIVDQAIRCQHPEWVESDGSCPRCSSYVYELADAMDGRSSETKL